MKLKSFRSSAAVILTTLMLIIAAATAAATAQTYTDLYNFDGTDGQYPYTPSILAQGRDGNLYGTTILGGSYRQGVVFKITPNGTLNLLRNFLNGVNGSHPNSGLTLGTDGRFYGTTEWGGANNYGTIFKITAAGTLTTLYSFMNGTDGAYPFAPPIEGTDGNFYGTTEAGVAYKISPSGAFSSLGSTPYFPNAPLLQGTDGNFYGTSVNGGSSSSDLTGTVFKMTPKGIVSVIYSFDGASGAAPFAPLIQGSDGNFYSTSSGGGDCGYGNGCGTLFKLTPQGAITVLHNFGDPNYPNDGLYPYAGLVQATDGNFYGVASYGGTAGHGVFFQITPAGDYSILYNFDGTHGASPWSTPMQHTDGKLYGLTYGGGTSHDGVVYSFDMGLGPFVRLVSTSGRVGQAIELLGQGFTGTISVSFNGNPATHYTIASDTLLGATVPEGATTGFVTVTTPSGTLTSNQPFRVTPQILSFTPPSGPVGTSITITGISLTQTTKVTFDGIKATNFTVDSDTQVTATVPTGAVTGVIGIITAGGSAPSPTTYTVTP